VYEVEFYYDKNDVSEIVDYLDYLHARGTVSKHERINHKKIISYLDLLEKHGTYIGEPVVKHIVDNIWELRPLDNRIFFFYWKDNKFVMLHHFVKKTMKTPAQEIKKAKAKLVDHIERHGE
jgi:phage-related protein